MRIRGSFVLLGLLAGSIELFGQEVANREQFLLNAEVVNREVISSGITLPQVLELEMNGKKRRAVFKSFEIFLPRQHVTVGEEQQEGLRDSWKFEVAAYRLDKLLGMGMVPVTVERKIEGREGALIDWVENLLPELKVDLGGFEMESWEREIAKVWLFDYLAYNIDRTPDNLLVTSDFQVRLIDHSRSFQRFLTPMRPLFRFPRESIERLRTLGPEDFREALGPYLTEEEMEAFLERRKRILDRVAELLASRPESEVYF